MMNHGVAAVTRVDLLCVLFCGTVAVARRDHIIFIFILAPIFRMLPIFTRLQLETSCKFLFDISGVT